MDRVLSEAIKHWSHVAPIVKYPKNNREFDQLACQLDKVLEIVGDDENHPLIGLVDAMSALIDTYEQTHVEAPPVKGLEALKFLMEAHHLSQSSLPEVASQGVLSEILSGKRRLNLRQIKLLAKRFGVDPTTFIDD